MRIQANLKSMNKLLTNYNKEYESAVESLQKCYLNDLVKYQEDLLLKICGDYELDYNELHEKYVKNFKKTLKKSKSFQLIDSEDNDSELTEIQNSLEEVDENLILEKIEIEGTTYYYDQKNSGSIFNKEAKKVGDVDNGKFSLHKN